MTRKQYLHLITELSLHSGYHKYEISDILHSLAVVTCRELQKGNEVYLEGIGSIIKTEKAEREFVSNLTGERFVKKPKIGAKIKIDKYLSNGLNLTD
jgi:nucleoid DNA-binding protein